MNNRQRVLLALAMIGGVGMGLFPPWKHTYDFTVAELSDHSERPAGYAFIGKPPEMVLHPFLSGRAEHFKRLGTSVKIDMDRLSVQYGVLVVIAVSAFFILSEDRRPG